MTDSLATAWDNAAPEGLPATRVLCYEGAWFISGTASPSASAGTYATRTPPGSIMRTLTRSAAIIGLMGASAPVYAGGIGVIGSGGIQSAKAYYYNGEGEQGVDTQFRSSTSVGGEAMLGDPDDTFVGIVRLYGTWNAPVENPDVAGNCDGQTGDYVCPDYNSLETDPVGAMTVGIQWGMLGDPRGLHFGATIMLGSAFATPDNLEYFIGEPGVFVTYTMAEQYQMFVNVNASVRFRKEINIGANSYVGVRYLFD
jgi:hypothetical protein